MRMNLEKYNQCFKEIFDVDEAQLNENFVFGEAPGWDSLAHMELISKLEDTFSIFMDVDDITRFGSYANGKKILRKYGVVL